MSTLLNNGLIRQGFPKKRWSEVVAKRRYSEVAMDYFARVQAAGGSVTHPAQIDKYIRGLVERGGGFWDNALGACLFVGSTFPGCFVPLREGMPVSQNVNFTTSRHDITSGLQGDGAGMSIKTGLTNDDVPQNDNHLSVFVTEADTVDDLTFYLADRISDEKSYRIAPRNIANGTILYQNSDRVSQDVGDRLATGFIGMDRKSSTAYIARIDGANTTQTRNSRDLELIWDIYIFARADGTAPGTTQTQHSNGRLAGWHIGNGLTSTGMAALDALQKELVLSINPTVFD